MVKNLDLSVLEKRIFEESRLYTAELYEKSISFMKEQALFKILELSPELLVVLDKTKIRGTYNIGFPFPLQTVQMTESLVDAPLAINFFLRGEPVRCWQREQLFSMADSVKIITDISKMQSTTNSLFSEASSLAYFDPYTYIGDSVIGMHFLESFSHNFNIDKTIFFSQSARHIGALYDSLPYEVSYIKDTVKKTSHIIMPDLLDSQWSKTLQNITLIRDSAPKAKIALVGRNILIDISDGKMNMSWYNSPDPLLRDKNIEDYMNDTLEVFVPKYRRESPKKNNNNNINHIFINPFGSLSNKEISPDLAYKIYCSIRNNTVGHFQATIIGGYREKPDHKKWVEELLGKIERTENIRGKISISYYSDLSALSEDMRLNGCNAMITADTSIAHFTNRLGIPNFTIYNSDRWDPSSTQSLASDSPLGFCRYFWNHIPIVLSAKDNSNYTDVADNITKGISFYNQSKDIQRDQLTILPDIKMDIDIITLKDYELLESKLKDSFLGWITKLYSPSKITPEPAQLPDGLSKSAIKISPIVKLYTLRDMLYEN